MLSRALIGRNLGRRLVPVRQEMRGGPRRLSHDDGGKPMVNMPFSVRSRYATTVGFAFFFGIGYWAPFFILEYSMRKNNM